MPTSYGDTNYSDSSNSSEEVDMEEEDYEDSQSESDGEIRVPSPDEGQERDHFHHRFIQYYDDSDNSDDSDELYYDEDDDYADVISMSSSRVAAMSPEHYLKYDPTPDTQYPKPDWITPNELHLRKYGFSYKSQIKPSSNMNLFEKRATSSLWMIQRLKKTNTLNEHTGSVNCLDFDSRGKLLCSGSDDRYVCIWDWQTSKLRGKIHSGHNENIVQSQFCNSNYNIVTSSRDGTVRIIDLETEETEKLFSTSTGSEIGKLEFTSPETIITCSTNGSVNMIDLRTKESHRLLIVRLLESHVRLCPLHTITTHPFDKHKIAVAGASPYVYIYDLRRVTGEATDLENTPLHIFDNHNDNSDDLIVTSIAYNSTGDKLLINYNDGDLVVCRTDTYEVIHRYKGHRNKKTIKGCIWFGDSYVMSGSDDGHIYGWELESEHIVCFLQADSRIVNCLCLHPDIPILASSGIDYDVKIWEPNADIWPQTLKGIKQHICRNSMRRKLAQRRREESPVLISIESD